MEQHEVEQYRRLLLALRNRLQGNVEGLTAAALEPGSDLSKLPIHMADVGTESFDQEFALSLIQNQEETLGQISEALDRVEEGRFGLCDECEQDILPDRLEFLPYTPYCIECARKIEREGRHRSAS